MTEGRGGNLAPFFVPAPRNFTPEISVKVLLADASKAQLTTFATTTLGLELGSRDTANDIRAKIAAAGFTDAEIEVEDEASGEKSAQLTPDDVADRDTVLINIPQQDGIGGNEAVPVGVNGKVARIMRGVDVRVPVEYVEVLKNATKTVYDRGPNQELINERQVPSIPFSIVGL